MTKEYAFLTVVWARPSSRPERTPRWSTGGSPSGKTRPGSVVEKNVLLQSSAPGTPLLPHASLGLVLLSLPLAWAIAARRSVPSGFLGIGSWGMTLPRPDPHPQPWAAVPLLCGPLGLPLTRSRGAMGENAYFEGSICGLCSSPSASVKPANVNVRISFSQRLKGFVLICSFGYTCSESHDLLELLPFPRVTASRSPGVG